MDDPSPLIPISTLSDLMKYYNKHGKACFAHLIPKCASTSIRFHLGQSNEMNSYRRRPKKKGDPVLIKKYFNNSKKPFTFTFVRNPWERILSCWNNKVVQRKKGWQGRKRYQHFQRFEDFICKGLAYHNVFRGDGHMKLQVKILPPLNQLDFIGKVENFEEDFNYVLSELGLPLVHDLQENKTNHKHYTEYYSKKTRKIVAAKYAKDIQAFGYKFGK